MAFFTPGSGNSLFQQLHSLFFQGSFRLWYFLIWHFDSYVWSNFDFLLMLFFVVYLFFICFVIFPHFCLIFDFLTQNLYAHFCLFFFLSEFGPVSVTIGFFAKNYIGYTNSRPNWRQGSVFYEHLIFFTMYSPAPPSDTGHSLNK